LACTLIDLEKCRRGLMPPKHTFHSRLEAPSRPDLRLWVGCHVLNGAPEGAFGTSYRGRPSDETQGGQPRPVASPGQPIVSSFDRNFRSFSNHNPPFSNRQRAFSYFTEPALAALGTTPALRSDYHRPSSAPTVLACIFWNWVLIIPLQFATSSSTSSSLGTAS
jgi:hypothetical protein